MMLLCSIFQRLGGGYVNYMAVYYKESDPDMQEGIVVRVQGDMGGFDDRHHELLSMQVCDTLVNYVLIILTVLTMMMMTTTTTTMTTTTMMTMMMMMMRHTALFLIRQLSCVADLVT